MAKKNNKKKTLNEEVKDIDVEVDSVESQIEAPEIVEEEQVYPLNDQCDGWFEVTAKELATLQVEGKLKGYRPKTKQALLK